MASSIDEILAKVGNRIVDDAGDLSPALRLSALTSALSEYESAFPREVSVSVDGDGGFDYVVADELASFVDGFSSIRAVVFPYLSTDQTLTKLGADEWALLRLPTGLVLRFLTATPQASEDFLVVYTARHTLSDSTSTIPANHDEALADLGAACCCDALAARYGQEEKSSIGADAVDRLSKAREWRSQAALYRKSFQTKVGAGDAPVAAAGAIGDMDSSFGDSYGRDYFWHGRART